ncbi:MAG: DUF2780 domain-containing protein [Phycisphaerales bacterium]
MTGPLGVENDVGTYTIASLYWLAAPRCHNFFGLSPDHGLTLLVVGDSQPRRATQSDRNREYHMQDFINMAVKQLGINESQAKSATGGVLGALQGQMPGGDFSKLMGMLPGAQDLLKGAAPAASSGGGGIGGALGGLLGGNKGGGGGLGNLASMASSALGGKGGGASALLGVLGNSGISGDKAGGFLKLFMDYVGGKGGGDLLKGITGGLDLKSLLG